MTPGPGLWVSFCSGALAATTLYGLIALLAWAVAR